LPKFRNFETLSGKTGAHSPPEFRVNSMLSHIIDTWIAIAPCRMNGDATIWALNAYELARYRFSSFRGGFGRPHGGRSGRGGVRGARRHGAAFHINRRLHPFIRMDLSPAAAQAMEKPWNSAVDGGNGALGQCIGGGARCRWQEKVKGSAKLEPDAAVVARRAGFSSEGFKRPIGAVGPPQIELSLLGKGRPSGAFSTKSLRTP